MPLSAGDKLGPYEILAPIGAGFHLVGGIEPKITVFSRGPDHPFKPRKIIGWCVPSEPD